MRKQRSDIEIVEHVLDNILLIKNIVAKAELTLAAMKALNQLEDEILHKPQA